MFLVFYLACFHKLFKMGGGGGHGCAFTFEYNADVFRELFSEGKRTLDKTQNLKIVLHIIHFLT